MTAVQNAAEVENELSGHGCRLDVQGSVTGMVGQSACMALQELSMQRTGVFLLQTMPWGQSARLLRQEMPSAD